MDITFCLLYAMFIGIFELLKKFAIKKSNELTILVLFTTTAFLLSLIWIPFGLKISSHFTFILAIKGLLLAINWFLLLKIIKSIDLSIVVISNVLSSVLSFFLGIIIFNETAGILQIIGSIIIVGGVAGINLSNKTSKNPIKLIHVVLLLISALISSFCGVIDRYTTLHITNYQTQFWFLFFVCIFSWIFFISSCIKQKSFLIHKHDLKNVWIYLIGISLFIADFMLFQAYKVPNSQLITITIISKCKVIIPVLGGIFIFKEKNVCKKLIFTLLVILGAVLIAI